MNPARRAFHITIHARPADKFHSRILTLDGCDLPTLDIPALDLKLPFAVSFEEASASLSVHPRMFLEPDGSFVWVASDGITPPWQIDGQLFDRKGLLLYVELKGTCSRNAFGELLSACNLARAEEGFQPATAAVVQLVHHAVFVDAAEFSRCFLED